MKQYPEDPDSFVLLSHFIMKKKKGAMITGLMKMGNDHHEQIFQCVQLQDNQNLVQDNQDTSLQDNFSARSFKTTKI